MSYKKFSYVYYHDIQMKSYIFWYYPLTYDYSLIFFMFCIKLSHYFDFLSNIESVLLCYFWTQNFEAVKEIVTFAFLSTRTSAETKSRLPKPSDHWKMEHYVGSGNHGKVDLDSDVNRLATGNLWRYTTLTSHCEIFPYAWMWHILYFDCWFHF